MRRKLLTEKKENFIAIDGITFWSGRWGKVKISEPIPGQILSH